MHYPLSLTLLLFAASATAGDAERGQLLYQQRCIACHSVDVSMAGPAHRGVFGRQAASVPGFDYSPALCQRHVRWTAANLDRWLADPQRFAPGQTMGYAVLDARDRADLIAYLRTLK